jgi:hypothetical protein
MVKPFVAKAKNEIIVFGGQEINKSGFVTQYLIKSF